MKNSTYKAVQNKSTGNWHVIHSLTEDLVCVVDPYYEDVEERAYHIAEMLNTGEIKI